MKKPKIVTVVLLAMTVFLMGAIFYIGYILTANPEKTSPVAPQKTKAQSGSYSKFIALETSPSSPPSPTEIVLTYQNPTPTSTATLSGTATPKPSVTVVTSVIPTVMPTKVATLPQTGFITNAIILFGVSALVIFISFIF